MSAANPYFSDYQPQNAGVFSFFDDLSVAGSPGKIFTQCSVSYTVLGYHTLDRNDPLYLDVNTVKDQTFSDRLSRCSLIINNQLGDPDKTWLNTPSGQVGKNMRTLSQGSLFGLPWSQSPGEGSTPNNFQYPGDAIQQLFSQTHPVAVGTNPVDALFAWLRATDDTDGITTSQIRTDLTKLSTYVLSVDDDVDSQLMAQDLLATDNFVPRPSGILWHFKAPEGMPDDKLPAIPTDEQAKGLRALNRVQVQLNAVLREQDRLKGELFAAWWTWLADRSSPSINNQLSRQRISSRVAALKTAIRANYDETAAGAGLINNLQSQVDTAKSVLGLVQAGTEPKFYSQRDPTLFIAGLSSKWPSNWGQATNVRLNASSSGVSVPSGFQWPIFDQNIFGKRVPLSLATDMSLALSEALLGEIGVEAFQTPSDLWQNGGQSIVKNGVSENGWFPLFIEWEAEYYHIPYENWEFVPQGPEQRYGYALKASADLTVPQIRADYRVLNGRCPVLPQVGASLETRLKQVFAQLDPTLLPLDATARQELLTNARTLDFAATPMFGLTDQLLTQVQGLHVLPLTWTSGGSLAVTGDARPIGQEINFNNDSDFLLMAGQTSKTPFASLVDLPTDTTTFNPFKPCTHGQLRFTKLNIIDKFGQIVQGIQKYSDLSNSDQSQWIGPTATPLFPCLGDSYSCEQNADGTAKIVLPRIDNKNNFVQLPPSINQDARINAMFLSEDEPPQWRPTDEWENPVRGWLLINQANVSLQIFTPDGEFFWSLIMARLKYD